MEAATTVAQAAAAQAVALASSAAFSATTVVNMHALSTVHMAAVATTGTHFDHPAAPTTVCV